jgi:glycerol kinase
MPRRAGAIFGLTRNTGPAEFARAALESVAYQTRDLLDAMKKDWKGGNGKTVLRVDGGMVASDWTMQRLADILDAPVDRPTVLETTALGAAWLAGSRAGVWPKAKQFSKAWALDRQFKPVMEPSLRNAKLKGWHDAVRRTLTSLEPGDGPPQTPCSPLCGELQRCGRCRGAASRGGGTGRRGLNPVAPARGDARTGSRQ